MENRIPSNSPLPSSQTRNSNIDEWTLVEISDAEFKQMEFDKMKIRLSKLEELSTNRHTIPKEEHEAKIVEIEEKCQLKIATFQEQLNQMKVFYDSKIAELKEEFLRTQNECASNFFTMAENHVKEETEFVTKIDEFNSINSELKSKIDKLNAEIQELKAETHQMQDQLSKFLRQNASLTPTFYCEIFNVLVDGNIDYEQLNGTVLVVKKLEQKVDGKWFADDYEISFEHQNFKVSPKDQLILHSDFDTAFSRVLCNKFNNLCLHDSTIPFLDLKKLIATCNNLHHLCLERLTVEDENGNILEVDQLWKNILAEASNIEKLFYHFKAGEITTETAQKLSQLPSFTNIEEFHIYNIQESFDLKDFGEFIKKNSNAEFYLYFSGSDEFYAQIKNVEEKFFSSLPKTCKLYLYRLLNGFTEC